MESEARQTTFVEESEGLIFVSEFLLILKASEQQILFFAEISELRILFRQVEVSKTLHLVESWAYKKAYLEADLQ